MADAGLAPRTVHDEDLDGTVVIATGERRGQRVAGSSLP